MLDLGKLQMIISDFNASLREAEVNVVSGIDPSPEGLRRLASHIEDKARIVAEKAHEVEREIKKLKG